MVEKDGSFGYVLKEKLAGSLFLFTSYSSYLENFY